MDLPSWHYLNLIGPDRGSPLKSLVSAEHQIILSGNGWGSKLTRNDILFHSRYRKGDWQHSYAFDGDSMDPSSCCYRYHHTCWPWLGRSDGVFGHCWAPKDMTVHCGWGPKPTWNGSHIHLKHERWLINFLCCGWECWSVFMPWHQLLSAQRWEVHWNLWYLLNTKWYCQEMVVALTHMEWYTLPLQTYKRWLTTFIWFWWG